MTTQLPSALVAGRYELAELLGRGGMADVYAAMDQRLKRPVAVKLLKTELLDDDDVRACFRSEARTAAAVGHPNTVVVYDSGEHQGIPFVVMERLPGGSLADRIAAGPSLDADEARRFGAQVLGALGAAHAAGVVHRDVKPGNLLFAGPGVVKVADFGIARRLADPTGSRLVGTAAYLAPERLEGGPATPQGDLYSLGVVLYEALAGRKPYDAGDDQLATARLVSLGSYEPLAALRPDLDADLVAVVERAMDRDPSARFASSSDMAIALSPFRSHYVPVAAKSLATHPETRAFDRTDVLEPVAFPPALVNTASDAGASDDTGPDAREAIALSMVIPFAGRQSSLPIRLGVAAAVSVALLALFLLPSLSSPSGPDGTPTDAVASETVIADRTPAPTITTSLLVDETAQGTGESDGGSGIYSEGANPGQGKAKSNDNGDKSGGDKSGGDKSGGDKSGGDKSGGDKDKDKDKDDARMYDREDD